jgi:penicillin-binding protein 1B
VAEVCVAGKKRLAVGLLVVAAVVAGVWAGVGWLVPLPTRASADQPTLRLYAGTEEIAVLNGLSRRAQVWHPLAAFPPAVVDAVLIAEDRRFFRHRGIDALAVLRALTTNLRHGEIRQGASTITQQLARTLFLARERGWGRKLHEAGLALLLEFRYSKPRILEAYLNTIYLGQDGDVAVHGLATAARHFLGKDLSAVRADEAALLAGAISSPNKTLGERSDRARAARASVLSAMRRQGLLDEARAREAMARPLPAEAGPARVRAPYFVDLAREEIAHRLTLPSEGELRIATSLDARLQRAAERAVQDGLERIERRRGRQPGGIEAALVAIEPGSGQIRALVGGRRYLDSPFNRATRAARQPGSLFKPVVYLAAFELGGRGKGSPITPASLIPDEALTVQADGRTWTPKNVDGRLLGNVTVRRAVEESRNVPAVRVALDVGLDRIVEVARRLGIRSPLAAVPSLALGTSEVTLLEITGVYAALANHGIRTAPTTLAAAPPAGTHVSAPLPAANPAVSPESAYLVTHLLRGVMRHGTGRGSLRWGLSDVTAGKTGTTDGLRDAWFVGYTPDLAVGVWVGRDDGSPLGLGGAEAALPIWAATMAAAVRQAPPKPFTPPPGVVLVSVDRETGQSPSFWCDRGRMVEEAFRAGTEPPAGCGGGALAGVGRGILSWFGRLFR